jgi:glyoxylase-like metal-dependent hydrolase (beta-lactamase superfamily II)
LLVAVPRADVLFAGALLFPDGDPWAGDAHLGRWIGGLSNLLVEPPTVLVPLHGAPLPSGGLRAQRDALAWLRAAVANALGDGLDGDALRDRVRNAPDFARHFSADGRFGTLLVERAIRETRSEFKKHLGALGKEVEPD